MEASDVDGPKAKNDGRVPFLRQCFVTFAVSTNIVGHGAVIGLPAILIPSLRLPNSNFKTDANSESWIASIIGFALIVGNIVVTYLTDKLGRKKSNLCTFGPIMVGYFLLLLASNVATLIAARFLQGISMGMLGSLGSIIIGEMTDPKNRGAFLTMVSLSLTIGVLFVHGIGSFVSWQTTTLICSFITFSSCLMTLYTPESPCWLASKGRYDECRDVFRWLRGQDAEQEEELEKLIIAQITIRKSSIKEQNLTLKQRIRKNMSYFQETIKKKEFFKPIVIMMHVYTLFQFAGINVISSYATDIIRQVVGTEVNANFWMVALSIERLICNLLAVFVMRLVKRRTVLFTTVFVCIISYLGKALYVYGKQNNKLPFDSQWIPLSLIGLYMFSLSVGISSVPFTISGELFPLAYRGLGSGISIMALSLNFFVAVKCFPVLNHSIGLPLTYCLYASVVLLCSIVAFFMLPETKDRTLQEIENSFTGRTKNVEDIKASEPLQYGFNTAEEALRRVEERRCSTPLIY